MPIPQTTDDEVPADALAPDEDTETPEQSTGANLDQLGADLRGKFAEAETEKQIVEQEWLTSLRQFKGLYDPEIASNFQPGKSRAFIRLTRTKVKSADARCMDMLFPAGNEKNFQVDPTPVAEVNPKLHGDIILGLAQAKFAELRQQITSADDATLQTATASGNLPSADEIAAIEQAFAAKNMQGIPPGLMPSEEEVLGAIEAEAKKRCDAMSKRIDDQLGEMRYPILVRDVIHSGNLYGTGILKGPLVERKVGKRWSRDPETGSWAVNDAQDEFRPFAEFVPIWDIYPDQAVSELSKCEYVFQRHVMSRAELRKLKNRPDYDADEIESYIKEHPDGDAQYKNWETELRNVSKDLNFKTHERRKHYEVLEFWGVMDGADLANAGLDIPEEMRHVEAEVNAWIVGNRIIKIELNPTETSYRPYHFYYFEKDDTSIWGIGIADIYRWAQQIANASMRATLDNLGITAGPVYEINLDLLDPDDRPDEIFPFRIIYRRGKGQDAQYEALRVHEASSRTPELLKVFDLAKQLGDETTALPSYTHGEQDNGVSRTVGGMSMLMGAATVTMKDVIRNFDDGITKPFVNAMYDWNMQFSDDESIKGDYRVSARGSSSLVAKELYGNQLDVLAGSMANPLDAPYIKRLELNRARFTARDLDPDRFVKERPEVEDELRSKVAELEGQLQEMVGQLQKSEPPQVAA